MATHTHTSVYNSIIDLFFYCFFTLGFLDLNLRAQEKIKQILYLKNRIRKKLDIECIKLNLASSISTLVSIEKVIK